MTQRIFDIKNEKDYTDLWDILSEDVNKIVKHCSDLSPKYYNHNNKLISITDIIKINFHDKTEITRPIPEVTLDDIGKLCLFWNDDIEKGRIAIFANTSNRFNYGYTFCDNTDTYWKHCRRLTKQEIEKLC